MALAPSHKSESVRVVVRCRPLSKGETEAGHSRCVDMDARKGLVELRNPQGAPGELPKTFTYDAVYDWNSKQRDLYDETFSSLVQSCLDGYNATIFAYGQTGTGKTHTMQGLKDKPEERGVIPNSFEHIFNHITASKNQQYLVRASYLEIYLEEVRDLLARDQNRRLELRERPDTGTYVKDLSSFVAKSVKELDQVMNIGNSNRAVGATNMNEQSSRSHAIFILTVECSEIGPDGKQHIRVGKLNLVDLAGSERQAKTGATGDRLKEATKINLSLSALGNVISALVDAKSSHIPYRDSKLTRLLQDSLGGNSKTVMVANVGPADYNYDETLSTLRYASRAKQIKNQPKINEDPKDALLREFQEEIARLKAHLAEKGPGAIKRRVNPQTGEIEEYEDEEGGADDEQAVEEYAKEQQAKLEKEKAAIMNDATLISSEREKLLNEVNERKKKLTEEQEASNQLAAKIKAMESKLLIGTASGESRDIRDHTAQQERELSERQRIIAEQKQRERELEQALMQKEESAMELQETYKSLAEEVEAKTKKLRKLFAKHQAAKQELADLANEHARQRQELEQTQQALMRELRLKQLMMDSFIPAADSERLRQRAVFNEEDDSWVLQPAGSEGGKPAVSRFGAESTAKHMPLTEFARIAASVSTNPRYRRENILMLELDMPARTTSDYDAPVIAPQVQAALEAALADEEGDLDIDVGGGRGNARSGMISSARRSGGGKSGRARNQQQDAPQQQQQAFPTSRGIANQRY